MVFTNPEESAESNLDEYLERMANEQLQIMKKKAETNKVCYCCGRRLLYFDGGLWCANEDSVAEPCKYYGSGNCLPDGNCEGKDKFRCDELRVKKDFKTADLLRSKLEEQGIILEDTAQGTSWRRK